VTKPGVERRAHPRIPTEFQLQGSSEKGGVVARMVANNLSLAGLRCTSASDFPEMTRLAVRLLLPTNNGSENETEPVDLEAVVVRSQPLAPASGGSARFELGLFFTGVDDETRQRLASFIAAQKGSMTRPSSLTH
jgi:hypothetical protein